MRIRDALYDAWPALVDDCASVLAPYLREPHALFGHSFGGRLAYEVAQKVRSTMPCMCRRLFIGGCRSPDSPQARPYLHELAELEFRAALRTMGGTPAAVLEDERLMNLMLPALRGDMRLAQRWSNWHATPLDVPLHVYYGHADLSTAKRACPAGEASPRPRANWSGWTARISFSIVTANRCLRTWMRSGHHEVRSPASAALATNRSPWTQAIGWQVSAFFAFQSIVFYSIVSWYATIAASRGVSPASAGVDLLLFQIVAIATNLGAVPIIKRAKDQRFIGAGCGLLYPAGSVGMMLDLPFSTLWLLLGGLGAGLSLTTSLSLFALRSASHEQAAELSGMAQFVGYGGGAPGPIVFGVLHEMTSNWTYSLAILVAASMLVTLFAYQAGRDRTMV